MTVSAQAPYNTALGNGVTTVFPFQFKILASSDLQVYVAGVLKTLGVDYTVTGVGNNTGGSVIFISGAPAPVATVSIIRARQVVRATDYQQQGDFNANTVNPDFDRAILLIQDLQTQLGRSVRLPADEVNTLPTLPSKADRIGKYASWNALGNPIASAGTGNDSALRTDLAAGTAGLVNRNAIDIPQTAAEAAALVVPTNGSYLPGDVRRYGASAAGTAVANTIAIQKAFNIGIPVFGGEGEAYATTAQITVPSGVDFIVRGLRLRPNGAFTCLATATTTVATTTLAADVRRGKRTITVSSGTSITAGQRIKFTSTRPWLYDATLNKGETNLVLNVVGTTVTLATPTQNDYDVSEETVTITVALLRRVSIDSLDIDYGSATAAAGLGLDSCTGVCNARVRYATAVGISPVDCFLLHLASCVLEDTYSSGTGYGIQVNSSSFCWASDLLARNCRRAFDVSGGIPSYFCGVDGFMIIGNTAEGSGLGGHSGMVFSFFRNGTICCAPIGVQIRGPGTVVENIHFFYCGTFCTLNKGSGLYMRNITHDRAPIDYDPHVGPPDEADGYFFDISGDRTLINAVPTEFVVLENIKCSPIIAFCNIQDTATISRFKGRNINCMIQNNSGRAAVNAFTSGVATTFDNTCEISDSQFSVRGGHGVFNFFSSVTWNGRIQNVRGYVTDNGGVTAAIATGATVNHGLGATPIVVNVTAQDAGPTDLYVTAKGASTFTVNFGGGGSHVFAWSAKTAEYYN